MDEDLLSDINLEEIENTGQILADVFFQSMSEIHKTAPSFTYVNEYSGINNITHVIDLDLIASATAGITDPLGQLRDWFINTFNTVASWIASSISTFINENVIPKIAGIGDWLSKTLPDIGTSLGGIPAFISDKIITPLKSVGDFFTVTLPSLFKPVTDFFTVTLPSLFAPVTDFFTKTLPSLFPIITDFFTKTLPSLFPIITKFFTETLPSLFPTVINFFTKTLPSLFSPVIDFFTKTLPSLFGVAINFFTKTLPSLFPIVTDFFTKTLPSLFAPVTDFFTKTLPSLFTPVTDFFTKTLPSLFKPLTDFFTKTLPSLFTPLTDFFTKTLPSLFTPVTDFFTKTLPSFFTPLTDFFTKTLPSLFTPLTDFFTKTLPSLIAPVTEFFTKTLPSLTAPVTDFFTKTLPTWVENAKISVNNFIEDLKKLPSKAPELMIPIANAVWNAFPDEVKDAISTTKNIFDILKKELDSFARDPLKWIKEKFIDPIAKAIWDMLPDFVKNAFTAINDFFNNLVNEAKNFAKDPLNWIKKKIIDPAVEAIQNIFKWIWEHLPQPIRDIISAIKDFFTKDLINFFTKTLPSIFDSIKKELESFVSDPLKWIKEKFIDPIAEAFSNIGKWIWEHLPESVKNALNAIHDFFNNLVKEAGEFAKDPLNWIKNKIISPIAEAFKAIGEWIWDALPQSIKDALTAIKDFLSKDLINFFTKTLPDAFKIFIDKLKEFFANPVEWLQENVLPAFSVKITHSPEAIYFPTTGFETTWATPILPVLEPLIEPKGWFKNTLVPVLTEHHTDVLGWLWDAIKGAVDWLINTLKGVIDWLWKGIISLGEAIINGISNAIKGVIEFGSNLGKRIVEFIYAPVTDLLKTFFSIIETGMEDIYKRIIGGKSKGEWIELSEMFLLLVSSQFTFRMMSQILMWIGEHTEFKLMPNVAIKIFSAGTETTLEIPLKFGSVLKHLASEFREYPDTLMRGFMYGVSIWYSRPIARLFNYLWRNKIPIELPPVSQILEYTRRKLPLEEKFKEVWEESKKFMGLYGFSDTVVDQYLCKAEELYLAVKDRFGVDRKIPLSLMYRLPSPSDVATMMVRDIFPSLEEFQKIYLATGMEKDVGALYYFLRFRYPPPERLWQFTSRGISGLLWVTLTDTEKKDIEKEINPLKAIMPVSPTDLNFKFDALFSAFKTYMKWHDYFRGSWIPNFTSDNLIYIDTLADVPTKIDQRWMTRFGLYELLSERGVKADSPIKEFRTKIMEDSAKSPVQMDLVNFCRTLQATGLHPDWVPITAVAETINAITDERTLLRTGVLGAFKEGFINLETIENVLKGAIITSFHVYAFDSEAMSWKDGWVNVPLMFLPPERKLTELRALFDRSMDILKEIQRDITVAYQENIVADYNEYKEKLSKVIDDINKFFASEFKAISGTELTFKFVEEYYKPYVDALSIYRDVHIVRRIRSWTMRWLGWLMYRIATGVTSKKEYSDLVNIVKEYSKLTDKEEEFLRKVMDTMYGIAVREYAPTPSQLATLSEYIVIPQEIVNKSLDTRMLPEEWRGIWKRYIDVRPIADDIRGLITTYRRALIYTTVPDEIANRVKEYAKLINFTDREFEILGLRVSLEELILQSREYIPTLSQLATICEYVPEARGYFDNVVKARRVPKEWIPIWAKYIDVRPLVDDVKRYVSRAEDLYVRFMTKKEDFQKILDEANKWLGYTSKEIEFLMKVTEFERYRNAWTELIGSVERLVSLSEYSPKASKYALGKLYQMIDALPLSDTEKQELKAMWEEYIKNRPVKSEARTYITQLINLFVDGLISDADFDKELNAMKSWGFSDDEIMFYKAQANLRKARKLRIPVAYAE